MSVPPPTGGARLRRRLGAPSAAAAVALVVGTLAGCSAPAPAPETAGPSAAVLAAGTVATPAPSCSGTLSLTFDDGPAPGATDALVRVLDDLDVPATFFMVGRRVDAHPELARLVSDAGYPIGNHSYDHEDLTTLSPVQIRSTLRRTTQALQRAGAAFSDLVRLPYGRADRTTDRTLRRGELHQVGWNSPAHDGGGVPGEADAGELARRVLGKLRPDRANVALQHDGGPDAAQTIEAVPIIVERARARGYCVVGLDAAGRPQRP